MAIHKSRASETARLVADVVSGTAVEAEAATARLIVLGARSVPRVRTALAAAQLRHDDAMTARLLDILSQVSPAAAVDAAAGSGEAVGPLHAASVVDAWHAALDAGDRGLSTRALDHLTALTLDATAARPVRQRALDALRESAPDVVAPLVARVGAELELDGTAPLPAAAPRALDELPADTDADLETLRARVTEEGDSATLSALHRVIGTLRAAEHARRAGDRPAVTQVRTLVHQVLARRQSTVAVYDLRDSFERDPAPLAGGDVCRDCGHRRPREPRRAGGRLGADA